MKSLFDKATYDEVMQRMGSLHADSTANWGKMNASQMLAHCKEAFKVPLSEKKMPRMLLGVLFGWMMKSKLYDDVPWKKNLPTAPNFIIKDQPDFEAEKKGLTALIHQFHAAGPGGITKFPHPLFGKLTPDQWGKSMYKHLDHHLQQFGV